MMLQFDIESLLDAYARGLSPLAVVETVYDRLEAAADPGIFIHLAPKEALLREAAALGAFDPAVPLWGVPFAVKDNIDVAGMPTTAACPAFSHVPQVDATVVALLKRAGALCIGKTNMDQFATGLVGVRTPYPVPRNAIDPTLAPGGSSSGSAVVVARGIVAFALGTDTAGSGRIPAGLNNIVGLKPTLGALSTSGVTPACRSLDCVSIFALTVEDAYRVFEITATYDASDPFSKRVPKAPLGARPPRLRVGVPAELRFFGDALMEAGYEAALGRLVRLGCQIVALPFEDFHAVADLLYRGAFVAERYAAIREFIETNEAALHPVTRAIICGASRLSAVDAFESVYALRALQARIEPLLASVDLLCVPTAPTHYTLAEIAAEPIDANTRLGTYTNFVNLLDLCGVAVPVGALADGRPASVTLLAPANRDTLVAALARDLHADNGLGATGWRRRPRAAPPPDDGERIEIVVVGAHLSGMPLNGELTALGARFSRVARTAPGYRLYALAGQTPPKPGLMRDETSSGAVEIEVWTLDVAAFGRFVASVPPPLCIGTVRLADGSAPKGFLVEPAALNGADDITVHGGWRAYCLALAEPHTT
ncbi:allophanate hydrolase [Methylosinus sp. LW4]|uniref:allophanate hydrolase n=1 Tax=Methylosinus sp. LW4 TaxID=136993 RepID=UPI00035FD5D7|nr:allophanate hydrolase [Methylosinus sp. LW4]